jgi:GNAT superfamily N-acetyltransferase
MLEADVVRRWQAGWSLSRGFAAAAEEDGVLAVPVGDPGRRMEFVVVDADRDPDSLRRAASLAAGTPGGAWVTVMTGQRSARSAELRSTGLDVAPDPQYLMTIDLSQQRAARPVPAPYQLEGQWRDGVLGVRITAGETLAARGFMALTTTDATADMILTDAEHRRRGLGAAVMAALVQGALERGARTGLLVASAEGHELYGSLGWDVVQDVLIGKTRQAQGDGAGAAEPDLVDALGNGSG